MDPFTLLVLAAIAFPFFFTAWLVDGGRRRAEAQIRRRRFTRAGLTPPGTRRGDDESGRSGHGLPLLRLVPAHLRQSGVTPQRARQVGLLGLTLAATGTAMAVAIPTAAWSGAAVAGGGFALLPGYLLFSQRRHRRRLATQFPAALEAMVRALYAGVTVDVALRMIAREHPAPMGSALDRLTKQVQVGVPMRDALRELQARNDLPELHYFVITLLIQRESGGQVAKVLDGLAQSMRRRALFEGKLRALTAESRFTAWFIGSIPLLFIAYKYLFDRASMAFFLEDPSGRQLLLVSLVLIGSGTLLLRFLMRIRF